MTWRELLELAAALPEVRESMSYGTPALKVRNKLLTRLRGEDESLVLFDVPPEERDMLIEARPDVFHTTPHYDGYSTVLARLPALDAETAVAFLERRWRGIAPKRAIAIWNARRGKTRPPD